MGNLGAYQAITTAAKAAGGVDKFISAIEKAAFNKGAAAGAVGGGLVVGGAFAVANRVRGAWKAREARAEEAKQELRALVQEAMNLKDS
jgi:predicted MFS family arabinose efflux permease